MSVRKILEENYNYNFTANDYSIDRQGDVISVIEKDWKIVKAEKTRELIEQLQNAIIGVPSVSKTHSLVLRQCIEALERKIVTKISEKCWFPQLVIFAQRWFCYGPLYLIEMAKYQVSTLRVSRDERIQIILETISKDEAAARVALLPPRNPVLLAPIPPEPALPEPAPQPPAPKEMRALAPPHVRGENRAGDLRQILEGESPRFFSELEAVYIQAPRDEFAEAIQMLFQEGLPEKQKMQLREFLSKKFPNAHSQYLEYGIGIKGKKDYYERYFMPQGISASIEYLNSSNKKPISLPCTVCPSFKEFRDALVPLIQGKNKVLPQAFIIRCYKYAPERSKQLSKHTAAIYVYRSKEGKLRILSTDSTGLEWKSLNFGLYQMVHQYKELELFQFELLRQNDDHNCAVFSINDVIQFCKNPERIDDFLSLAKSETIPVQLGRNQIETQATISVKKVNMLPLGFAFAMQSLSKVEAYVKAYKMTGKVLQEELSQLAVCQDSYIEEGEVLNKDSQQVEKKQQNCFAERRGDKFEGNIWKKIVMSRHD